MPSTILPGTRSPADWPFDRDSPWNTPIGSNAVYSTINSPGFNVSGGGYLSWDQYSIPVYQAASIDPLRNIYSNGVLVTQIHVPDSATPAPGTDGIMTIIAPDGHSSVEIWQASRRSNMDINGSDVGQHDLLSKFETAWQAPRASGLSTLGGLIQQSDFTNTADGHIHHALALSMPRTAYNRNAPDGLNWIWPALGADDGTGVGYSSTGNLYMGSLLAIAQSFNLGSLPFSASSDPMAYQIAWTLQNYGAYTVDSTSDNLDIYISQNADLSAQGLPTYDSQYSSTFLADLASVIQHLTVVSNNSSTNVGGGGTPLQPLAPDWASSAASTATTLISSLNPAASGQSVTFTATVSSGLAGTIAGTVTFRDGGTTLGSGTLSNGQAIFTIANLATGVHSITASYSGAINFSASSSAVLTETIHALAPSSTKLTTSLNPAKVGQSVIFTATVTSSSGIPTGIVTFKDGSTTLGTSALSSGHATFTTADLTSGSHRITASYAGDSTHLASISSALNETIRALAQSSTKLTASLNPAKVGQSVTFAATVAGSSGTPTGTVTFKDGTAILGSASLVSGKATFSISTLTAGSHSITAIFSGNGTYLSSTSAVQNETITTAATVQVNLGSWFNRLGITSDGFSFSGGLDSWGDSYSANLLGSSVMWNGRSYNFGAANVNNVIGAAGQSITLPGGNWSSLSFLATAVNGNQASQRFTVKYTDGTTQTFTQSLSDWFTPQLYSGESKVATWAYRNLSDGTNDNHTFYLYGYSFVLNSSKTVQSITLPSNGNVAILAIDLTV